MTFDINQLIQGPHAPQDLDAFFAKHTFPIAEEGATTFVWRGHADDVKLRHWIYGLESAQSLSRIDGTDVWHVSIPLPRESRVEYKFEVIRNGRGEWIRDPLNPHLARDPFGANSVAHGPGYTVPEWIHPDPEAVRGTFERLDVVSDELGHRPVTVYRPARFRSTRKYPLLVVHDGDDYLNYASMGHVLDNLMSRREIPDMIVAFTSSPDRLVEYANDERHARFLTEGLVPVLEERFPLRSHPNYRCLMGASFGAVASFSTAVRYPGYWGKLLLQSGSFAFTDIGHRNPRGPLFDKIVDFMNDFREEPSAISERVFVSCGTYESLIYENRSLVPVLTGTGMSVRFREARDGHNWENWRDRLREGLSWLFPGAFLMMYN